MADEASKRARGGIGASLEVAAHAQEIVDACSDLDPRDVVLAVVRTDHSFALYSVRAEDLQKRLPDLEADGWSMVFAPGEDLESIHRRCQEWERVAARRLELLLVRSGRQAGS